MIYPLISQMNGSVLNNDTILPMFSFNVTESLSQMSLSQSHQHDVKARPHQTRYALTPCNAPSLLLDHCVSQTLAYAAR